MKAIIIAGIVVVVLIVGVFRLAKTNHVAPLSGVSANEFDTYSGVTIQDYNPVSYIISIKA